MSAQAAMALPLAASVLLWLGGPWVGRRMPPAWTVRLLCVAMVVVALATGFSLAVAAFLLLAQLPPVALLGHWSVAVVASAEPIPDVAAGAAGVVVTALLVASARQAVHAGRDLVRAALICRRLGPAVEGLVVVRDDVPDAYALPGLGGRVVVSTAMLRALPAAERKVLLAHETAHLASRHHLYLQAAMLAAAANPLLRPAARAVAHNVERWADEVAAAEVGDRRLAARALARAGLVRAAARRHGSGSPVAAALASADAGVAERARALLAEPPSRRPVLAGVVAAMIAATVAAASVTARDTEDRFELAQSAYSATR